MALVLTDVTEGVATLTLNAPDTRNTMTMPMVAEIVAAMDAFEADPTVAAVIVTGAGPAFCAGADLGNLQTATAESLGQIYEGFTYCAFDAAHDRSRERRRGRCWNEPCSRL